MVMVKGGFQIKFSFFLMFNPDLKKSGLTRGFNGLYGGIFRGFFLLGSVG
jgi:hypothetical protein